MAGRILVVDDNGAMVRLVRACLEESGYEVLVAHGGETALHTLRRERPGLVLLDLASSAGDDGGEGRGSWGDVDLAAMPVVMLAARDDDPGAGVESRPFDSGELVARVRAVMRRVQTDACSPGSIQVGRLNVDLDGHQVQVAGRPVHLTPTEFALLRALAEKPGYALSRQEMIERGLGTGYEGLERTVDSHVKNLRRKLDGAGQAGHQLETVFGIGYRLVTGNSGRVRPSFPMPGPGRQ